MENRALYFRNLFETPEDSVVADVVIVVDDDDDILGVRDEKEKARATPFPEIPESAAT